MYNVTAIMFTHTFYEEDIKRSCYTPCLV